MPVLTCSHVTMHYAANRDVLKDVSFSLEKGSFHFLAGASGVGKTTLLSLLALAHRPTKGTIKLFGEDVTRLPRSALPALRRRIGTVSQDYRLLPHLSVRENVALPLKVAGADASTIDARVEEMLEWVGLGDHMDARPEELSGGQKQRVAIARAVINKPEILLCDEPSGNLDLELSLKFMRLFEALHKMGTTVLFATHDQYLLEKFSYPTLKLKDGMVLRA